VVKCVTVSSSHLPLRLSVGRFPSGFPTQISSLCLGRDMYYDILDARKTFRGNELLYGMFSVYLSGSLSLNV
jgi:hypothetical protein